MMNPRVIEAWFTIMAEASKGTSQAKEALKLFPTTNNPTDLAPWLSRFMAPGGVSTRPEDFSQWYEEWSRMMGFVPRSRYLELLERYEIVRNRLEDAEKKIRQLQGLVGIKGREEEAKKVLDLWGTTVEQTLSAQADWLKAWSKPQESKETVPVDESNS
jgi:hypothetical protein